MNTRLVLSFSLLAWLIAILSYVHLSAHAAEPGEDGPLYDRETATKRLRGAAINGWSKTAAEAIRYGAVVDETDEYGTTPLILASVRGHDRIVKLLLDAGADPNRDSDDRVSPLLAAAANCNDPVVALLLRKGANPNPRSQTRQTPLMRAAENGCAVAVKELLRAKNIDLKATDDSGKSAIEYARESAILGLDRGDSLELIHDSAILVSAPMPGRPRTLRQPVVLPRGLGEPRSMPRAPKLTKPGLG